MGNQQRSSEQENVQRSSPCGSSIASDWRCEMGGIRKDEDMICALRKLKEWTSDPCNITDVRKNWKLKFSSNHQHAPGMMPAKVFCMKADYAEGTGTHNTQNGNLIDTLYSEPVPAEEDDERVRTTIYGFPCVIYHQSNSTAEPVFNGKYNFNYDKGAENVFGFTSAYNVECWEFLNNTSDVCNFNSTFPQSWGDDFEARYPEDNTNTTNLARMINWVFSTKNDLEKFREEFDDYFDLHYMLIYYVYTFVMLMVDQRAKNMMMTYWGSTGKFYPYFYDNDTCLGIKR